MIKKVIIGSVYLMVVSASAQQQQQQQAYGNIFSNVSLNNQGYVQKQTNVLLASNRGNVINQAKAVQQKVARNINPQVQPLVLNNEIRQMTMNAIDINIGNEMNMVQQLAAIEMPALEIGTGNLDLNLEINAPKLNLSRRQHEIKSKTASNSGKYKLFQFEKKLKKMNRMLSAKRNGFKKLKIKVDDCFKW